MRKRREKHLAAKKEKEDPEDMDQVEPLEFNCIAEEAIRKVRKQAKREVSAAGLRGSHLISADIRSLGPKVVLKWLFQ